MDSHSPESYPTTCCKPGSRQKITMRLAPLLVCGNTNGAQSNVYLLWMILVWNMSEKITRCTCHMFPNGTTESQKIGKVRRMEALNWGETTPRSTKTGRVTFQRRVTLQSCYCGWDILIHPNHSCLHTRARAPHMGPRSN